MTRSRSRTRARGWSQGGAEPPATPTGFAVTLPVDVYDTDSLDCSWDAVEGATKYRIYRDGTEILAEVNAPATSVALSDLEPNTGYSLTVSAVGPGGESSQSDSVIIYTRIGPPTNLAIVLRDNNTIWVSFDYPANYENGGVVNAFYDAAPGNGADGGGVYIDNVGAPNTSFVLTLRMLNAEGVESGEATINIPAWP